MNAQAAPMLSIEAVGHSFGGFKALSSVTFSVGEGALVGLIGPNGSGKTTLFNIVSGFIEPLAGRVVFDGHEFKSSNVVQRSRQGLVRTFQTPKVFEHLTVLENVMAGLYKCSRGGVLASMFRLPRARREMARMAEEAAATCDEFGLGALKEQVAGALTAGHERLTRPALTTARALGPRSIGAYSSVAFTCAAAWGSCRTGRAATKTSGTSAPSSAGTANGISRRGA